MKPTISLFLFQTDPDKAASALTQGVDTILFDVERQGKRERQNSYDTSISAAPIDTLAEFVAASGISPICRIDAWNQTSVRQIEVAIDAGVEALILPMARTLEEIDTFATAVAGRTKIGLMIETLEILKLLREVAHRELSFVYVGLQDLMIARKERNVFRPLVDGTVERVRNELPQVPLGVGGATDPRFGAPIPFPLLAAEMSRVGADFTFLRRSFLSDVPTDQIRNAVENIRDLWLTLAERDAERVAADRLRFCRAVEMLSGSLG